MPERVLLVCAGNICRSPIAEAIMRRRLGQDIAAVSSAGLIALDGQPVDPHAESVLIAHGLSAAGHRARRLTPAMIEQADLVLLMERRQLAALRALAPQAGDKSFLLDRRRDIPDPYGKDRSAFDEAYKKIDEAIAYWCERLAAS